MTVRFYIRYHTTFGQHVQLCGNFPATLPMHWLNEEWWYLEWQVPADMPPLLRYHYEVKNGAQLITEGCSREVYLQPDCYNELVLTDSWVDAHLPVVAALTAPFTRVFYPSSENTATRYRYGTHVFKVQVPLVPADHMLCLLGSAPVLGAWEAGNAVVMEREEGGWFSATVDLPEDTIWPVTYKYALCKTLTSSVTISFESGPDRQLHTAGAPQRQVILHDGLARFSYPQWKGAGVAVPVFSMRSAHGFGVGEFADLPLMAQWARQCGLQLIQLLPVNDTIATNTWKDSYPYAAISAFALHPIYLRLQDAGTLDASHPLQQQFDALRDKLNSSSTLDYEAVLRFKLDYLRALWQQQEGSWKTNDYITWQQENAHWLEPYAIFCYLRDQFGTCDFSQWRMYSNYDYTKNTWEITATPGASAETEWHCFVQYQLHLQLQAAVKAVHRMGVALKGDIPIGISAHSVDAWTNPADYHMNMQAGAPPDAFTAAGQNWGFPTYNWEHMAAGGYLWWQQRLQHLSRYFDAFRIDHILGFFRIWQIPRHAVQGVLGYFYPAIPVTPQQLHDHGIAYTEERFCKPYITTTALETLFGKESQQIITVFLEPLPDGTYRMKPGLDTQRRVQHWCRTHHREELLPGLLTLTADVLFIQDNDGHLHPRYAMDSTCAFKALDADTRIQLLRIYENYFYHIQEPGWEQSAMRKLPAIRHATSMLICGEDLGMVPRCVPGVMESLGILSLEIQRMPKTAGHLFTPPAQMPYLSVLMPSTHDMSTLRQWWEEDAEISRIYYRDILRKAGTPPATCTPALAKEIIRQHLETNVMWCNFQLQDLLALSEHIALPAPEAERINIPAVPQHYWRYRMPLTLEALLEDDALRTLLSTLTSGRKPSPGISI